MMSVIFHYFQSNIMPGFIVHLQHIQSSVMSMYWSTKACKNLNLIKWFRLLHMTKFWLSLCKVVDSFPIGHGQCNNIYMYVCKWKKYFWYVLRPFPQSSLDRYLVLFNIKDPPCDIEMKLHRARRSSVQQHLYVRWVWLCAQLRTA